jgi:hypothetical protein
MIFAFTRVILLLCSGVETMLEVQSLAIFTLASNGVLGEGD